MIFRKFSVIVDAVTSAGSDEPIAEFPCAPPILPTPRRCSPLANRSFERSPGMEFDRFANVLGQTPQNR